MQLAAVQYILDTVVQALDANPDRKFVYGEMVSLQACSLAELLTHFPHHASQVAA